ncbi:MAG: hypothetical protein JST93_09525 [Acidobacteria bacterium]|nr:hypothetical protein [Acidobacteriota bacterium]
MIFLSAFAGGPVFASTAAMQQLLQHITIEGTAAMSPRRGLQQIPPGHHTGQDGHDHE